MKAVESTKCTITNENTANIRKQCTKHIPRPTTRSKHSSKPKLTHNNMDIWKFMIKPMINNKPTESAASEEVDFNFRGSGGLSNNINIKSKSNKLKSFKLTQS